MERKDIVHCKGIDLIDSSTDIISLIVLQTAIPRRYRNLYQKFNIGGPVALQGHEGDSIPELRYI